MKTYTVTCAITKKKSFWNGRAIPINGKPHTDEELGVSWEHYHIDWRYLNEYERRSAFLRAGLGSADTDYYFVVVRAEDVIRLEERQLVRCDLKGFEPAEAFATWLPILEKNYEGVTCKGNRCPHRGADLSNCIPDKKGRITCPYHALVIDKKTMTVVPYFTNMQKMRDSLQFIDFIKKLEQELEEDEE